MNKRVITINYANQSLDYLLYVILVLYIAVTRGEMVYIYI